MVLCRGQTVNSWNLLVGYRTNISRRERFPPWDPQSQWYQLHRRLESFRERLPRDFAFSQANVSAHLSPASSGSSTPYILLHTTLLLSDIILHRDYIPFIPLRCTKPQGPLDSPLFPPDEYQIPPQWWEQSATELFKSARDLINLLHTSREWGDQLMTPLVGFGLYTAAFVGMLSCSVQYLSAAKFHRLLQQSLSLDGPKWLLVQKARLC